MKKKILIVDDSPSVLEVLYDILNGLGYAVTSACNGEDAYEQVESITFNMIITDLVMPGMNGIEFVKRAKKLANCKFVPVVMLSSEGSEAKIADARRAGVSTFLKKPINEDKFIAMVKIVLGAP